MSHQITTTRDHYILVNGVHQKIKYTPDDLKREKLVFTGTERIIRIRQLARNNQDFIVKFVRIFNVYDPRQYTLIKLFESPRIVKRVIFAFPALRMYVEGKSEVSNNQAWKDLVENIIISHKNKIRHLPDYEA